MPSRKHRATYDDLLEAAEHLFAAIIDGVLITDPCPMPFDTVELELCRR